MHRIFMKGWPLFGKPDEKEQSAGTRIRKTLYGAIDKSGNYVVKRQFSATVWQFSEGLMAVCVGNPWTHPKNGYIDKQGRFLIEPTFRVANSFHDGRAVVVDNDSSYAIIDKQGHLIRMDKYESVSQFREGLAPVCLHGKWGYVDTKGKLVIDCKFDKAGLFQEGLAAVGQKIPERSSVRLGFINTTGRLVIPFDFVDVRGGFSDGLAAVATQDKARPDYWFYGYIDHSAAWIIKPIYDDAQPFSEGLAAVCTINRNKHPAPPQPHAPPYLSKAEFEALSLGWTPSD